MAVSNVIIFWNVDNFTMVIGESGTGQWNQDSGASDNNLYYIYILYYIPIPISVS